MHTIDRQPPGRNIFKGQTWKRRRGWYFLGDQQRNGKVESLLFQMAGTVKEKAPAPLLEKYCTRSRGCILRRGYGGLDRTVMVCVI